MVGERRPGGRWFTSVALVPLLIGPSLIATTASAQAAKPAAAADAASPTGVQEVIVTATRRSESLSKVPESVSAFTAAKMDVQGIKSFADLAKFTPGVSFDNDRHRSEERRVGKECRS